jgi:hypothetical protein
MLKHFMENDSFATRLDTKLMIAKIEHNKTCKRRENDVFHLRRSR